ncbi:9_t:CDS:2, partial [Gigaspora margarita]
NVTARLDEIEREYQTKFHQFATINATIQVLANQPEALNQSETSSQSETSYASSSSGSPSSNSSFFENIETRFKEVFFLLRRDDSVDYMCETVARAYQ